MASHTCEQCGAIVASDEQFCPSCGTFIDPMKNPHPESRPRPGSKSSDKVISINSDGNKSSSDPGYETFSLEDRPPPDPRTTPPPPPTERPANGGNGGNGRDISCPSCGAINPGNNRHCQECGARLRQGPLPTAPRPAVQATAGVRAALAIGGLLLGVILFALFFNIFTSDDDPEAGASTTTPTTTPVVVADPAPIEILDQNCDPEGISGLICPNLTNGQFGPGQEYQVNWEELEDGTITITLTFREPMAITEIEWHNIDDQTRFRQNYRVKGFTVLSDDAVTPVAFELTDDPGTQVVPFRSLSTNRLVIEVVDAYLAEVVDEESFDELAIDEIVVIGRPVTDTTGTTAPGGTTGTSTPDDGSTSSTAG